MTGMTPGRKGAIAEAAIAAAAIKLGFDVYRPVSEGGRYDLIIDVGGRLVRTQCKWAAAKGDVLVVRLRHLAPDPARIRQNDMQRRGDRGRGGVLPGAR